MTPFEIVEKKLKDGMCKGQMHTCLRDIGRLAGGYSGTGALRAGDMMALESLAVSLSDNPKEGRQKWLAAVEFGRREPVKHEIHEKRTGGFGFDDAVYVGHKEPPVPKLVDSHWTEATEIPTAGTDLQADMIRYLEIMFEADERVGIVNDCWEHESGKLLPKSGMWDRTRAELVDALKASGGEMDTVIGTINPKCGTWVRINPLDGSGCKDLNVTCFRHSLIECEPTDEATITNPAALEEFLGKQLTLLRETRLPVTCLVHSAGKSIHALVRVDAKDINEYRARVDRLYKICEGNGLKVDQACRNPARLSRLPGVMRNGRPQYLISEKSGEESWDAWIQWIEDSQDELPDFENLGDYINDLPEKAPELIHGVLRRGHRMQIAGPSGAGKSYLLAGLSVSVTEGWDWCGFNVTQGEVLYVNLELDRAECFHRFSDYYKAMGREPKNVNKIDVWNLRGNVVPMDKLAPKLIRRAMAKHYSMVILDPIYKLLTGSENEAYEMVQFLNEFDRVATALGAAVVYTHHHSKGSQGQKTSRDRASGSGVFARDPDAGLDMIELDITKDRRAALDSLMVRQALEAEASRLDVDISGVPDDFRHIPDQLLDACCGENPLFDDEFRTATLAAHEQARTMSGWRIESSKQRCFAPPKDRSLWFKWPIHIADMGDLLKDAKAAGEEPPYMAQQREKQDAKRKRAEDDMANLDKHIDNHGGSGQATLAQVTKSWPGMTEATLKRKIKASGDWRYEKGTIYKESA